MAYYILQEQSDQVALVPREKERHTLSILALVAGVLLLVVAVFGIMCRKILVMAEPAVNGFG